MAWYYSTVYETGENSPYRLQARFTPDQIYRHGAVPTSSGAWNKYRAGTRIPRKEPDRLGNIGVATIVGNQYPNTLDVLGHPLWKALNHRSVSIRFIEHAINNLPLPEARYYAAAASGDYEEIDVLEALNGKIWIEIGDHYAAFDHFALHSMILKTDIVRNSQVMWPFLAKKMGRILGFVAGVPWVEPYFEELFDWMDINLWGRLFNVLPSPQRQSKGWRRTEYLWIRQED